MMVVMMMMVRIMWIDRWVRIGARKVIAENPQFIVGGYVRQLVEALLTRTL